jgi:hypothetical protein
MGIQQFLRRGRRAAHVRPSGDVTVAVHALEPRSLFSVAIQFDYSLDAGGFFTDPARRAVLQSAADSVTARLTDTLAAVTPGNGNSWSIVGTNPSDGQMFKVTDRSVAADTVVVFAGAYDLAGATLGLGGPTGWSASGTSAWLSTVRTRGESGATTAPLTDFAPTSGSIAFDSPTSWYFGTTTTGLSIGEYDFFSVAAHELGHVLGVGTSGAWESLASTGKFTGARAAALYGGPVPLDASHSHWADGAMTGTDESALDPSIARGVRKTFTALDYAALDDIGWDVAPAASVSGVLLVNAGSNATVGALANGATINLSSYPGGISLRASTSGTVGSVRFTVDGVLVRTENASPYTIAGDNGADILPWTIKPGTHTLVVTPFSGANGTGTAGAARTVSFTVLGAPAVPSTPPATVRVNATAGAVTLGDGRVFDAASGFTGGTPSTTPIAIASTTDDALYYTRRWGKDFSFARAVPNGTYVVRLHMADPSFTATGKRVFDVFAEGTKVLADFDIVAATGGRTALTRDVTVTVRDGQLDLRWVGKVDNAIISAITIAPRLEAESATRSGVVVSAFHAGYTGSGYADYEGTTGEFIQWSTGAASTGPHNLIIRYGNGGTTARSLSLQVNGVTINTSLVFAPTGSWSTWKTLELTVHLVTGTNTLRLTSLNALAPNVDSLVVA